jgi:hypothetical protein
VRLGWVADWDDLGSRFFIMFGREKPDYEGPASNDAPFAIFGPESSKRASVRVRPGQQKFRFQVFKEYGLKCGVCPISHSLLLHAAHLCGKAHKRSDDWRNGLPLCATHHVAFDADLFAFDPETLDVVLAAGMDRISLGIQAVTLATARGRPHIDALRWRFNEFHRQGAKDPSA